MEEDKVKLTDFELFLDSVTDLTFNRLAKMQPEGIKLFASIATDIKKSLYNAHVNTGSNYPPEKLEGLLNVALIQFGIAWAKSNRERERRFNEFMAGKDERAQAADPERKEGD